MKWASAAMAMLVLAATPGKSETAAPADWMAGAWVETKGDDWTEEHWTRMRAGVMLGAARSGKGQVLGSWEQTRIERGSDGKLIFWASPAGAKPIPFALVSVNLSEIVFANPDHDYPQRIRYWRNGKSLNAEIALMDGTQAMGWQFSKAK